MGCFSVQSERKKKNRPSNSCSSLAHPSRKGLLDLKPGSLPSSASSNSSSRIINHHVMQLGSTPSFRARAALHSASSKLVKNHSRALVGASSSLRRATSYPKEEQHNEQQGGESSYSHCYGYGEESINIIAHSAPIPSLAMDGEEVSSNGHLFPLPLPPAAAAEEAAVVAIATDDTFTGSDSSASSSSSVPFSSCSVSNFSCNFKSYNNPLSSFSISKNHPPHIVPSFAQPLPLPPPPESGAPLREFSFDELAGACLNFAPEFLIRDGGPGPVFRAIVSHVAEEKGTMEVAVTRLSRFRSQSFKKWRDLVGSLARLSHPHLCKLLGFSGEDSYRPPDKLAGFQRERLLVYEHTSNGSLDTLLYCRKDKAPLDWAARLKIAMGAAEGLAFLHDRTPRQIVYKSLKTLNVQVDQNFNAKLSDYGFARNFPSSSPARSLPLDDAYAAPETLISGEFSTKSNVWSFGIVLLELLTGRQNMDVLFPSEERNLLQWCRPYLLDSKRLYLVMDPELKGRYPTKNAKIVADLAMQCLSEDPVARPSMRDVVVALSSHVPLCNVADSKVEQASTTSHSHSYGTNYNSNSSKLRLSKSYSLASVLATPARSVTANSNSQEQHNYVHHSRTRFRGFLSGEITKEASRSMAGSTRDNPFLSRYGFLSGEIVVQDYGSLKPPISSSSGTTPIRA